MMVSSNEKKVIKLGCLAVFAFAAAAFIKEAFEGDDNIIAYSFDGRWYLKIPEHSGHNLCTQSVCRQRDPPGETALGIYRSIAQLLHWKNCDTDSQCTLAYLMVPKAGSTTIKSAMNISKHHTEIGFLSPDDGTIVTNYNPLIFTVIRDPRARIVSAYSTITSCGHPYGWVNGNEYFLPEQPNDTTDILFWKQHFK
jgi:hypothetical protein